MTYVCPVCGFEIEDPPENHTICPCCSTHFGYEDAGPLKPSAYWPKLRQRWIDGGMEFWHGPERPAGWDAIEQIAELIPLNSGSRTQ